MTFDLTPDEAIAILEKVYHIDMGALTERAKDKAATIMAERGIEKLASRAEGIEEIRRMEAAGRYPTEITIYCRSLSTKEHMHLLDDLSQLSTKYGFVVQTGVQKKEAEDHVE